LVPFLPGHPVIETGGKQAIKAISGAPYGSAMVLPITHAYIKMLGGEGLTQSTKIAILNANYLARELSENFGILYTGTSGRVGHEMIVDCRHFRQEYGVETVDIAKRLMDYGFHAPTLSFPVHETLMVEPTESESKEELDRFVEAMNSILEEIQEIRSGKADAKDNLLKNAPHTALECTDDNWEHPYSRHRAAYPLDWITHNKFWPSVARVDDGYGDRNLVCSCAPISEYLD
jgi:glycine dehydrogenase